MQLRMDTKYNKVTTIIHNTQQMEWMLLESKSYHHLQCSEAVIFAACFRVTGKIIP